MAIRTLHDVLKEISSHDGYFHEEDLGPDGLVSVNARGVAGDTPLHVAAWGDDTADAAILLSAGAGPNIAGDMDETPLHVAVRRGNVALIVLLLKAGADPDVISEFEESPAGMAAEMGGPVAEAFVRTA